jgi:CRISPR-associated endonuclease Csn1
MRKILGLDLGSSSIGWAYIIENEHSKTIQKLGVRIVPIDSSARDAFSKGQAISVNKVY